MPVHVSHGLGIVEACPKPRSDADAARISNASFFVGLGTATLNPFTLSFFLSLFLAQATFHGAMMATAVAATVFVVALCWFAFIGLTVSRSAAAIKTQTPLPPFRFAMAAAIFGITIHSASQFLTA